MKQHLLLIVILFVIGCKEEPPKENVRIAENISLDSIIKLYKNPSDQYVMVIAHRADWRSFPENSIEAIRSAIKLGVDMVEIDVRRTKDGSLVLMHDETIDRTTNGSGKVSEMTFDEIKLLRLMSGVGVPTDFKVPTLKEALLECKGKIMINLDKADNYFDQIYPILKETNTINQVVLKGHYTTEEFKSKFGDLVLSKSAIDEILEGKIDEKLKSYSRKVDLKCNSDQDNYYIDETVLVNCSIKNTGNIFLDNIKICLENDCKVLLCPVLTLQLSIHQDNFGSDCV